MKAPQIVIGIAAALVLAGGGFAAGMTFDKAQNPATSTAGATGASGARGGTGARGGFGGGGARAGAGPQARARRHIAGEDRPDHSPPGGPGPGPKAAAPPPP